MSRIKDVKILNTQLHPRTSEAPIIFLFLAPTIVKLTYRNKAQDLEAYWVILWPWQEAGPEVDLAGPSQESSVVGAVVAQITQHNKKILRPGAIFATGGDALKTFDFVNF